MVAKNAETCGLVHNGDRIRGVAGRVEEILYVRGVLTFPRPQWNRPVYIPVFEGNEGGKVLADNPLSSYDMQEGYRCAPSFPLGGGL